MHTYSTYFIIILIGPGRLKFPLVAPIRRTPAQAIWGVIWMDMGGSP